MIRRTYFLIMPNHDLLKLLKSASDDTKALLGESILWTKAEADGVHNSTDHIEQVKLLFLIDLKQRFIDGNPASDFTALLESLLGSSPFTVRSFDRWWSIKRFGDAFDFNEVEVALTLDNINLLSGDGSTRLESWLSYLVHRVSKQDPLSK